MLVLSRKPGEAIHIGSGITITVVEIKGSRVRVGIQAPDEVPVLRAELINSMVQQLAELPQ
jgi:carbon storage regulator